MNDDLTDTVLCLFMAGFPGNAEPENQCWQDAVWHIWYEPDGQYGDMTSACDAHLGRALAWRAVKEFHMFGSACNVPGSWWVPELGACVSEETGLELGYLRRVGAPA